MEKLIELLNESTNGRFKSEQDLRLCIEMRWYCRDFIKWLVENDKINEDKIDSRLVRYIENHFDEDWYWVESSYEDYPIYERLLMLLSISDTPIKDLVSYLK